MPLRLPIFEKNGIYHVYNRGHNKQTIFLAYKDYVRYLKRANEYLQKHKVSILTYCLMPNHLHFVLRQTGDEPIERFLHRLHTSYTMYFNKKYERVGAVFQGRFKAKRIDTDEYLLHVSRYIHLNPIELFDPHVQGRALSSQLIEYPWSSYHEYIKYTNANTQPKKDTLSDPSFVLNYFATKKNKGGASRNYKEFVLSFLPNTSPEVIEDISKGIV